MGKCLTEWKTVKWRLFKSPNPVSLCCSFIYALLQKLCNKLFFLPIHLFFPVHCTKYHCPIKCCLEWVVNLPTKTKTKTEYDFSQLTFCQKAGKKLTFYLHFLCSYNDTNKKDVHKSWWFPTSLCPAAFVKPEQSNNIWWTITVT